MDRIHLVSNHLSAPHPDDPKNLLKKYRNRSTIDPKSFSSLIFDSQEELASRIYNILLSDPVFKQYTVNEDDRKEQRMIVSRQLHTFFEKFGFLTFEDQKKDPTLILKIGNYVSKFDVNLTIKVMVQFMLYTQTLILLGTEKHRKFIDAAFSLQDLGCFALTELGHGSNVNGILTRADFDSTTREFVLNTPTGIGMKFWIGAAGQSACLSVVFAQLYVQNKKQGVHAFIVPLRSENDYSLLPGITAGDCGLKVGWNGIDNGFILFKDVRIPYDNLLDRFSSVDKNGEYQSTIKNAGKRFALTISALSGGRVFATASSVNYLLNSLTIAIRFSTARRQFGPPNQQEVSILEYPTVQYRLIPYLAETIALAVTSHTIRKAWHDLQETLFDEYNPTLMEFHAMLSCFKPFSSWLAQRAAQECREVCGGLGYSAYNRIGSYYQDNDVVLTGEGDNNVLLQQTVTFLLGCLKRLHAEEKLPFKSMYFLTKFSPKFNSATSDNQSNFFGKTFPIKAALEIKANLSIHACAQKMQDFMSQGADSEQAWKALQIYHCRDAAKAYYDLYLMNEFEKGIEKCHDSSSKQVLFKLYDLCGFHKIERDPAILMESGYLNRQDLITVRENIINLCADLKNEALGIVDALATPDGLLNSPIGSSDGDIYNRFIGAVWTAPGTFEKADYWKEIVKNRNSKKTTTNLHCKN